MDTQDYKQPRFDEIEKEVRGFLKKIGFKDKKAI